MSALDHELRVVREGLGWRATFVRGSVRKEAYFDTLSELNQCVEKWFIEE